MAMSKQNSTASSAKAQIADLTDRMEMLHRDYMSMKERLVARTAEVSIAKKLTAELELKIAELEFELGALHD